MAESASVQFPEPFNYQYREIIATILRYCNPEDRQLLLKDMADSGGELTWLREKSGIDINKMRMMQSSTEMISYWADKFEAVLKRLKPKEPLIAVKDLSPDRYEAHLF